MVPIVAARALPDEADATIEGTLTTALGALEAGRSAFVQDATGGIGIYLDAAVVSPLPAGTTVRITGTLGTRFAQRVLRVGEAEIEAGPVTDLPSALDLATGSADETHEGSLVAVTGVVDGAPGALSDGLGLTVDDGSGPIKAVIGPAALAGVTPVSGDLVTVRGPLGQRDSSGTGTEGYRVYATLAGDFTVVTPSPTPRRPPHRLAPRPSRRRPRRRPPARLRPRRPRRRPASRQAPARHRP